MAEENNVSVYDDKNAFLSIYAGTGGKDAEDWVTILARMYQRYLQKKGFKIKEIQKILGEGGIKSVTYEIKGKGAFGLLKRENGVHRLVRISPFSAKKLRHTSFALVEVLPEIDEKEINLKDEDLKIETFRASGAGGQYVNRRESAVRITHIPTGLSVSCQSERLQGENKKRALQILQAKVIQYQQENKKKEAIEARGELPIADWGRQIRSYVFQPYQMVKDHRTGVKTSNLKEVLDGDLNLFIKK
ncbi:MAG TPA: PCRF domain-containing protein [Candidatus Pacearchaeota archaeon]|nr:PCRF domain-containing protein [Candidatus Pacearchaeota archaeon]HOK94119.1 PCRF domain-containing protein [Candidatus Pacearchaeota archaeon]HPO75247.1 PCRF domain-containing protein [Candidatus Pacearchaeota archaeon]